MFVGIEKLVEELNKIIPTYYGFPLKHESEVVFPLICFLGSGQSGLVADNTNYYQINDFDFELYFSKKDMNLEKLIEKTFNDLGYVFQKTEDVYIDSLNVFQVVYQI